MHGPGKESRVLYLCSGIQIDIAHQHIVTNMYGLSAVMIIVCAFMRSSCISWHSGYKLKVSRAMRRQHETHVEVTAATDNSSSVQ
jgi:hypothetical protein